MPVLIEELVISVEVSNQASGGGSTPPGKQEDKQTLIEECVEQVLHILQQRQER